MKTIRQTLISNEDLRDRLDPLPLINKIDEARRDHSASKKKLADFDLNGIRAAKEKLDEAEGMIAYDVINTFKEDGKPAFSNDAQRKGEINRRLKEDAEYLKAKELVHDLERRRLELEQEVDIAKIDVLCACDEYAGWLKMADIISGLSREQVQHVHETQLSIRGESHVQINKS